MKKVLLSALLAVLLCIPWTQAQTSTITINDGTATNGYVPVYGYFLDSYNMHSQMLIPSDSLTTINGNALLSLMFYLQTAGDASKNFSNNWTITLIETTATALSTSYEDVSSGTVVYTGLIDWKTTTPTITFASPYVYNGGNLLIDMHYTNSAGSYNSMNFYGVSSSGLSTMNYGSSDPTTATARSFSPKMTFGYGPAPTCYQPTGLTASNVTANSADFSWTASGHGETQYQYLCIPATDTVDWTNATLVSMTSDAVTGLTPNTNYKFYVRSYCSATDQSYVSYTSFKTLCAAVDPASLGVIGFETSEGFASGNLDNCWEGGNMQLPTTTSYKPYVQANTTYSTYSRTGSNCLKMQAIVSYTIADSCYAVMPEFTYNGSITSYEAHFYMCKTSSNSTLSNYNDTLYVGIVSDPADMSDLEIVGYAVNTTTSYAQQIVSFSSYNGGTTGYIVFLAKVDQNASASSKYASFYIDDLEIIKGRATHTPVVDSIFNITTTTVDVAFSGSNANSYRIVAATEPVSNPDTYTTWAIDTVVTASPATINVQAANYYYLYVQGFGTDTSFFSNPVTQFQSGCDVVASFPWTENFDEFTTSGEFAKVCWFNEHVDGPGIYPAQISTSGQGDNETPMLYFKDQNATTYTRVSTPEFNIPTAGAYEFNIDVYRASNYSDKTLEGVQVIVENTTGGYDTTFIPRNYSLPGNVGAETAGNTWYTYTVSLPNAGVQRVILLGCNQYGGATYIDNLRVRRTPNCFKVDSVAVRDNQPTQATIEWRNGTSAKYQVLFTSENINPDTLSSVPASVIAFNDSTASNVDSMLVTGLTPATQYYVYVRGLCAGEQSDWSTAIVFRTACQVLTISKTNFYTEGFENIDDNSKEVPCWDINTTSTSYPKVYNYEYYAHTGDKCLYFGAYNGGNDTTYMTLPETTNPVNTLRLKFWLQGYSTQSQYNDSILVGVMTSDAAGNDVFNRVAGFQAQTDDYELYEVNFDEYTGADGRIAMVRVPVIYQSSWYSQYWASNIDDVTIDLIPTCKKPNDFAASNITKRSVDLSWTATTASAYEVIVADQSIDPANLDSAALTHIIYNDTTITADSVTVNGLASLTTYYAYVRGNCGAGDKSEWTNELSFETAMAMNYVDSFTVSRLGTSYTGNYGVDSLLAGSDNLIIEDSRWSRSTILGSDSASVKMNVYGYNRSGYYVTPLIDLHDADTASLSFKLCRRAYGNSNPVEDLNPDAEMYFHVMVSTDGLQTFTNIDTWRNDSAEGQPVGDHSLYNDIPTYYQVYNYDLSAYLDQSIQIVFAAGQYTTSGDDYDIHLDDITIAGAYDSVAVTANVNDVNMGTVTGAGNVVKNSDATITAVANTGYHFVSWSNGVTTETLTFLATQDTTFTATFAPDSFNITALTADTVMGTVTGSGRFPYNYTAQLTATPNYGYHFTGWSNGDTTASTFVTVLSDSTITANFAKNQYTVTLTADPSNAGTVSGDGTYNYLDTVTVIATPDTNYRLNNWSNGATTDTLTFVITCDTALTANFVVNQNVIAVYFDNNLGTVTGDGWYLYGTVVDVTATPKPNVHFLGWAHDIETAATGPLPIFDTASTLTITLTDDVYLTAYFAYDTLTVTAVADPAEGGTVTGGGEYQYGTDVTLTATPNSGYEFTGWSNGDTATTITFCVTSDTTFTASFKLKGTAVDNVEAAQYVAYTEGQRIVVAGVEGHTVSVFDATGRLVATRTNANDTEVFDAQVAGVYMIKVNGMNTTAIVVK